jgi:SnoaL-like domain
MSAADKLEVTELLYRYAELIDSGDFDGVGQLLSRASFRGANTPGVSGAENIAGLFAMTTRRFPGTGTPKTRHLLLTALVDLGYFTERQAEVEMVGEVSDHPLIDPRALDR